MTDRSVDTVRLAIAVLLAAMTVIVVGCASSDAPEPAAPGAPATTSAPATGGTAAATILVDYRKSGGFAGLEEHLVVMGSGHAMVEGMGPSRDEQLDPATMRELTAALDQAGLDRLRPRYDPPVKGNDLIEYTVTYQGRTVTVSDTAIPPQLRPLLTELNQIMSEVRTS
ncbi:MAG TPA: protealysin inhibitor emfourin [Actinomycetota bacterium]|nr:protealysin inhibitor emfourin [Actinomycetota bacterium]